MAALHEAIESFLAELKEKEKEDPKNPFLKAMSRHVNQPKTAISQTETSAQDLQACITKMDDTKRANKGYRMLHQIRRFLEAFKDLMKKCESLLQVTPFGVSAAFVGVRVVLEMAISVDENLELVVDSLQRVAGILMIYDRIPLSSPDIGQRLVNSYKRIILFWYKLSKVLSSHRSVIARSILMPLKREIEDALKEMKEDMHINLGIHQVEALRVTQKGDQRTLKNSIKSWIMGEGAVDFRGDYEDMLEARHEGTCTWILEDSRFVEWQKSRKNALLWYHAQPGSGKSVLASAVIKYLMSTDKQVVYFFYSFGKSSRNRFANGLRMLALQLLAFVECPSDRLVKLCEVDTQFSPYLTNMRTLVDVVHELITRVDSVHVVLDGIDECVDEMNVLGTIEDLIGRPTLGIVRWLVTSRLSAISTSMRKLKAIEMQPNSSMISKDIEDYLSSKVQCDGCLRDWTEECDGNFLIARFVQETLGKLTSEEDIRAELETFPTKLNGYYMRELTKIEARGGPWERSIARRVFLILSTVQQTVSVAELLDALAIKRGSPDYSAERLPQQDILTSLCGSLIVIEKEPMEPGRGQIIRLSHKSIKDFFQQDVQFSDSGLNAALYKYFSTPSAAHEEIGLDCLTYLMYARYSKHVNLDFLEAEIPREHAFLPYAATFWFQHLGDASIQTPKPDTVQLVQAFTGSKAFWNCLKVQSLVAPYLFGRYTSRGGYFKMEIGSRDWHGEDGFGVPLPSWIADHPADNALRDLSLCTFADEWREVMITCPTGIDQCVPLKQFANSCYLKALSKDSKVQIAQISEPPPTAKPLSAAQLLDVYFRGKKLCVDIAYQTSVDQEVEVWRQLQLLFKNNSEAEHHSQRLPIEPAATAWIFHASRRSDMCSELAGWSIDPGTLNVRKIGPERSESFRCPASLFTKACGKKSSMRWELLTHSNQAGSEEQGLSLQIFHTSNRCTSPTASWGAKYDPTNNDTHGGVEDKSVSSGSDEEDSSEVDEYSDDEDSSSEEDEDSSANEDTTTEESDLEDETGCMTDTNCLVIIANNSAPYWTTPWVHTPVLWSKIGVAVHPDRHLVAFVRETTQLEVIDLDKRTETSIKLSGLMEDAAEQPRAIVQELQFSHFKNYLHCLTIRFTDKDEGTECSVTTASIKFPTGVLEEATALETINITHVKYIFGGRISNMHPPFALTYWCEDQIFIALPPLTCDPKIIKINLDPTQPEPGPVLTLNEPIYFPTSTPRRDARFLYREGSKGKDAEDYVFLVLSAVLAVKDSRSSINVNAGYPAVALRWRVCKKGEKGSWREWKPEEDGMSSSIKKGLSVCELMRGKFVESGKPFNVPIRCGLDWTRKAYLSCG
ncbi:hypothetical protein F5Y16DRAFT_359066 [Xylariaceae sp. FL0255]|nr:hypothetical protein F5Y16DRAFT_359066 [Xylariaceae sp. FL0255]